VGRVKFDLLLGRAARWIAARQWRACARGRRPIARARGPAIGRSPTDVVVQDCFDTTQWLLYVKATGEAAGDAKGARRQMQAVVRKTASGWKVDGLVVVGSC